MRFRLLAYATALVAFALAAPPAHADFHLMQIEQVIGGVGGDTSAQAIQLRLRANFQGRVSKARLVARDAAGKNAVVLIDFTSDVIGDAEGARILIASAGFAAHTSPEAVPDFTLVNLIPPSYLAAGSLTFEADSRLVFWRVSWGGSAYTGSTRGLPVNDPNAQFGPPFAGPLPSADSRALVFQGEASDTSTSNANDYALTTGAAVFANNSGSTFAVIATP